MKIKEMTKEVQEVAANALAECLKTNVDMTNGNRMERAKEIAKTIRESFEELFS